MQSIEIHKLGPIDDFRTEISDFMVFTGEQASGKSTIAKSIFFFKNIPELLKDAIMKAHMNSSTEEANEIPGLTLRSRVIKSIRLNFLRTFGSTWGMDPQMQLKYGYADHVSIKISLTKDPVNPNYIRIDLSDQICAVLKEIESMEWGSAVQNKIRSLFRLNAEVVYIPAGRSMLTLLSDQFGSLYMAMDDDQKRNMDYCTQNYMERILKLKPNFRQDLSSMVAEAKEYTTVKMDFPLLQEAETLILKILRGRYQNVNGEERLYLADGHYVKINFASSGQQETVWILNVLFYFLLYNKRAYFIIEEPESHLYPDVQRLITDFIALARAGNNQILLTTHSPYVLGELNNLLYAGKIANDVDQKSLDQIISSECWLQNSQFAAYYTDAGHPQECMDEEGDQIRQELIDGASDEINGAYDKMLSLRRQTGKDGYGHAS